MLYIHRLALNNFYLFQLEKESHLTDTKHFALKSIEVLKEATQQEGELNRKIEELIKKGGR